MVAKVGPVKARFRTRIEVSNLNPPESYTLSGEGRGGAAGFASGSADVTLESAGGETVLRYTARIRPGGKIAQVGFAAHRWHRPQDRVGFLFPIRGSRYAGSAPRRGCAGQSTGVMRMSVNVSMNVNGRAVSEEVEDRTLLVEFLREDLRLTGTHVGCDTSQCGACVVHVGATRLKACHHARDSGPGADVITIEGLADNGTLHPMQEAFRQNHGLQCGFCTPGMVMSALDLVARNPDPTDKEVREWLEGNLCRCTGYHNIVKSILAVRPQCAEVAEMAETGIGASVPAPKTSGPHRHRRQHRRHDVPRQTYAASCGRPPHATFTVTPRPRTSRPAWWRS